MENLGYSGDALDSMVHRPSGVEQVIITVIIMAVCAVLAVLIEKAIRLAITQGKLAYRRYNANRR